ncbi:MAG: hypothetical protein REI64_07835 [Pedobacter sp.]|uniref:hypothetical protein n=1 Tax=Pedobacter sp. TaxID=1411316 RepID=UPI002807BFB6|nr:hypothetical protein [Pedobacter sp.]MDQ8004695.1 hypothetical protein [Pedobacter sp.]
MNKQKLGNLFILSLLFALGIVYGAQVFVSHSKVVAQTVLTDTSDDGTENSEEKVNETSHHLFLQERSLYRLKPTALVTVNLTAYISKILPEAYLQLNTPPPDFD